jgi:hypothetical protein
MMQQPKKQPSLDTVKFKHNAIEKLAEVNPLGLFFALNEGGWSASYSGYFAFSERHHLPLPI